ncbi:MAG: hypothetical protein M3Q30_13335 [Actinomycetota bacterium]|nr:hypothetical protein [Actinomycetota bacterium]
MIVPSPNPTGATYTSLYGVSCTSTSSCFAVGEYYEISSYTYLTLVERWDGTSWAIVPSPSPTGVRESGLADVSCTSTTSCFAVGTFGHTEGPRDTLFETLVERWDGTSWAIVPSPNPTASWSNLSDVSCTSTTNCFAVGLSGSNYGPPFSTLVERWNGSGWAIVPSPNPTGATNNFLYGGRAPAPLAVSPSETLTAAHWSSVERHELGDRPEPQLARHVVRRVVHQY